MPIIKGTEQDDLWRVVNPGTFVIDGLGGIDTLDLGTSLRSSYTIKQAADGAVYVDTISGASGEFHATLYNFEKLIFANSTETLDLATYFVDTSPPTLLSFSPVDQSNNVAIHKDIVFNFSENILAGAGSILLKTADGKLVESFDVASSTQLTINAKSLTINPTKDFQYGQNYVVEISSGSVKDLKGNLFATSQTINFKTVLGETFTGTTADDVIISSAGSDIIDGSAGRDTVVYSGKLSAYALSHQLNTYNVTSKNGGVSGVMTVDSLRNVESLKFDDMTVNLQIQAAASGAPPQHVQRLIELYVAFFNRVPDADGLAYWLSEMKAGQTINAIAETFYNAGVQFSNLTGFSASMSNADFINVIYKNVLGRVDGADPDGLAYWNAELVAGRANRGSLVSIMLDSAHQFKGDSTWGWVANLLDNKIIVAKTFAIDWGLGYASSNDAILQGMAIAAAVTPTDTQVALTLIGLSAADMHLL
ncbi:Ig-like domain-containing protein [Undibacterium flavidum]|uniref:Ig-like domain-containing protein n=1 Tax=Undibacterium flavidum TaxID=2762297 RepID=A0ABR6YE35_9BURK|nr:Ig-like domain-containing protein [Undibacterium flavidum]MBC3874820.1 Ig-like domain-containing protein [Undibacterium flavidum]